MRDAVGPGRPAALAGARAARGTLGGVWRAWCTDCGPVGPASGPLAAEERAWDHKVWHWVDESTRASGVPFHVQDPIALRKIATLLRTRNARRAPRRP